MVSLIKASKAWLGLLALLVLVSSTPPAALESSAQDAGTWAPVKIVYNSDVIGKIEPCG